MIHKTILEISEIRSQELLEIINYWRNYTETTVLLAMLEIKRRRNIDIDKETTNKIAEFSSHKGKSISELVEEFLRSKDVETYDEYYDFKVRFLDKNSEERLRLNRIKKDRSMRLDKTNRHQAKKDLLYGSLWLVGGLVVTVLTLNSGSVGIIAYGAIIFGGIQFCRGLINII